MRTATACLMLIMLLVAVWDARGEEPVYAVKVAGEAPYDMIAEIIKRVPPLRHERGVRWPMILWVAGPFEPQPADYYQKLLARGLTQHIQMTTAHLDTARALQAAGSPVIMMQGQGGPWPAELAGDPEKWAHQLEAGYKPQARIRPCLDVQHEGWAIQAENVRRTLRAFRDAGVNVDAVWMDWEGDPMAFFEAFEQAARCSRCRATLPPAVLADADMFHRYNWRLYMDLLSAYLAAPVAEIFPACETTNAMITFSTPERRLEEWDGRILWPSTPALFTATNPFAYGNSVFWRLSWNPQWPLDREHADQFYSHLLLRMVSHDAANRAQYAPYMNSFPWVARWCPDDPNPEIPVLSRERYREILRHLWLRGVTGMQIFNPKREGFKEMDLAEIEDAVTIYDEMLADRDLLEGGSPLCYDVPQPQDDRVLWSGVCKGNRAVVRTFKPGGGEADVTVEAWPGKPVTLTANALGKTYRLRLEADRVQVVE